MQVKSLKLQGFKSFFHEREILFPDGITAIVGPNGCGKSNIVDAICWVLGEQSPRRLRGKRMEEILFNGSEQFPPTGMARVALQLKRKKQGFPHPFCGLDELCIERLLFRTGESEYRINQAPVRLKDVVDLFMDTGTGNRTYSIVEQGYISEIMSAGPEKIRGFIEGAAGIQKFKVRKDSAARKMEATQENLRHIEAILSEIQRQMNSLNRQAQKARRYKRVKEEIQRMECLLARREHQQLELNEKQEEEIREGLTQQSTLLLAEQTGAEAQIESIKTDLIEAKAAAEKQQEELWQQIRELNQLENRRLYLRQSHADVCQKAEETRRQLAKAEDQLIVARSEKEDSAERIHELRSREGWLDSETAEAKARYQALLAREKERQREIDEAKEKLFSCMTQRAEFHNQQVSLQDKKSELERKGEKNALEISQLKAEGEDLSNKKKELEGFLTRMRRGRSFLAMERMALEVYRTQLKLEFEQANAESGALLEALNRRGSRLHSLIELQENYEGYQDGVRAVMQRRRREDSAEERILGLVADLVETEPQYETALESALGERLQSIVVQEQCDGLQAIEYLKTETRGRGTFIPIHLRGKRNLDCPERQVGIRLLDVVRTREGFREISEYLIGDVVLVEDLDAGLHLWKQNGSQNRIVTREGELIDPQGVVTGGRVNGANSTILKNRREIKGLEAEVSSLHEDHVNKQAVSEAMLRKTRFNDGDLEKLQQAVYEIDIEILKAEKDLHQANEALRRCVQRLKVLETECAQQQQDLLGWRCKEDLNERRRSELDELCRQLEELLAKLNGEIKDLVLERDLSREELSERELEAQLLREKRAGAERSDLLLDRSILELSDLILEKKKEEAGAEEKRAVAESELAANEERAYELEKMRKALEEDLGQRNRVIEEFSGVLAEKEARTKETRKQLEELHRSLDALHLRQAEIRLKKENVHKQIWQKYQVDLALASVEDPTEEDEGEIRRNLDRAETVIRGLGEINPTAIEEFEELQDRHAFYQGQVDDLNHSMESLRRLIQRINRITKSRFTEAFQGINEKFQQIFPVLFNGGRAFLQLEDEKDPLESGVSIVAQPPGKRLQSANLFSGGEKTMTALSLILAIFQFKPSPFCILDEVDAALDDVNVGRFNEILKTISKHAQFILITHNKQTMEIADTLYGITMEQPGISQVVSVNMA